MLSFVDLTAICGVSVGFVYAHVGAYRLSIDPFLYEIVVFAGTLTLLYDLVSDLFLSLGILLSQPICSIRKRPA